MIRLGSNMKVTQAMHALATVISVPTFLAGRQPLVDDEFARRVNLDAGIMGLAKKRFVRRTHR